MLLPWQGSQGLAFRGAFWPVCQRFPAVWPSTSQTQKQEELVWFTFWEEKWKHRKWGAWEQRLPTLCACAPGTGYFREYIPQKKGTASLLKTKHKALQGLEREKGQKETLKEGKASCFRISNSSPPSTTWSYCTLISLLLSPHLAPRDALLSLTYGLEEGPSLFSYFSEDHQSKLSLRTLL